MLSSRHRKFCEGIVAGKSNADAYTDAGYKSEGYTASAAATRLLKNVKIQEAISSLHMKTENKLIMSITERKEMLSEIARHTKHESPQDAIRASAELSKMDGGYEPEKHEIEFIVNIGGDAE